MADALRRILYPAFVTTIVATLWAVGHARAVAEQVDSRKYWPAENPELFEYAETADADFSDSAIYFDDF